MASGASAAAGSVCSAAAGRFSAASTDAAGVAGTSLAGASVEGTTAAGVSSTAEVAFGAEDFVVTCVEVPAGDAAVRDPVVFAEAVLLLADFDGADFEAADFDGADFEVVDVEDDALAAEDLGAAVLDGAVVDGACFAEVFFAEVSVSAGALLVLTGALLVVVGVFRAVLPVRPRRSAAARAIPVARSRAPARSRWALASVTSSPEKNMSTGRGFAEAPEFGAGRVRVRSS